MTKERLNRPLVSEERVATGRAGFEAEGFRATMLPDTGSYLPFTPAREVDPTQIVYGNACACAPMGKLSPDGPKMAVKFSLDPVCPAVALADKREYERILAGPLTQFVVPTYFVLGHGIDKKPAEIQIQPWIGGRKVGEMAVGEILSDFSLCWALRAFAKAAVFHFFKTGQMVDYWGFGFKGGVKNAQDRRDKFSLFSARNLIWDGKKLHLIHASRNNSATVECRHTNIRYTMRWILPVVFRDYFLTKSKILAFL